MVPVSAVFIYLFFVFICFSSESYLDIQELRTINYGIDISQIPVLRSEDSPNSAVYVTSIYGQEYQCSIPDVIAPSKKDEQAKEALRVGIPDLLQPMKDNPCLIYTKNWWTYEFCYKDAIKQYHMEDGKIKSPVTILGKYESDFDWNNVTSDEYNKKKAHRYHTQEYSGGMLCDLTGEPRRTTVQFMCEMGHGDYINALLEPHTCVYTLSVFTSRICHHPFFKPTVPIQPKAIQCNPLLTDDDYQAYRQSVAEQTELRRLSLAEQTELRRLQKGKYNERQRQLLESRKQKNVVEVVPVEKSTTGSTTGTTVPPDLDSPSDSSASSRQELELGLLWQKFLEKSMSDLVMDLGVTALDEQMAESGSLLITNQEHGTRRVTLSPARRRRLEEEEIYDRFPDLKQDSAADIYEEVDDAGYVVVYEKTGSDFKSTRMIHVDEDFDLERDGSVGDDDKDDDDDADAEDLKVIEELGRELQRILGEADASEDFSTFRNKIENDVTAKFPELIKEAEIEAGEELEMSQDQVYSVMTKMLEKLLKPLEGTASSSEESSEDINTEDEIESSDSESHHSSFLTSINKDTNLGDTDVTQAKSGDSGTELDIDEFKRAEIEDDLTEMLQKEGAYLKGQKVHVKIVTGYYDRESAELRMLNDDETEGVSKMLIAILDGNNEANQEVKRSMNMEQAYKFTWNKGDRKKSKP